ncbi:MAG TPA: MerC domain-containing protein [Chitinophaga sp.]
MQTRSFFKINPDAVGIGASLVCAVHCIVLPILFTSLPLFGVEVLENMYLEAATILVSMSVGVWVLWRSYRHGHITGFLVFCFIVGLGLVIAGNFMHTTTGEVLLKFAGAAVIITVHAINWRQHKRVCRS